MKNKFKRPLSYFKDGLPNLIFKITIKLQSTEVDFGYGVGVGSEYFFSEVLASNSGPRRILQCSKFSVFTFGENILTVSQPNGMTSIYFHQCKK